MPDVLALLQGVTSISIDSLARLPIAEVYRNQPEELTLAQLRVVQAFTAPLHNVSELLRTRYGAYTTTGGIGMALWIPTYLILVWKGFRTPKTYAMPLVAICLAIGLNFAFSFPCPAADVPPCTTTPEGGNCVCPYNSGIQLWLWRFCLLCSVVLLVQFFMYGRGQRDAVQLDPPSRAWSAAVLLVLSIGIQYGFLVFNVDYQSNQLYFLMTLAMSIMFLFFLYARPDLLGISILAGWTRLFGDGLQAIVVFGLTWRLADSTSRVNFVPGHEGRPPLIVFVQTAAVIILDALFVWLAYRQRQRLVAAGGGGGFP